MMPVRVARDVPAKHVCLSSILNGISSYSLQSKRLQPNFGPLVQPGVDAALSRRSDQRVRRCPRFKSGMGRWESFEE